LRGAFARRTHQNYRSADWQSTGSLLYRRLATDFQPALPFRRDLLAILMLLPSPSRPIAINFAAWEAPQATDKLAAERGIQIIKVAAGGISVAEGGSWGAEVGSP